MGLLSYWNHWGLFILYELTYQETPLSIASFSERTGRTAEGFRALVRNPVTKTYALLLNFP